MFRFAATSALALGIGAAPVLADVTPAQVWENLQKTYADHGYEVSGKVEDAGGTLTVRDAVLSMTNEGGATTITIPQLTLGETGDAKVRVVIEGDMALNSTVTAPVPTPDETAEDAPADGTATPDDPAPATPPDTAAEMVEIDITGTIRLPGNEMLVSGTPEDMVYDYTYPSVTADIRMPLDPQTDATLPVNITLSDVTGTQRHVMAERSETSFDIKASEATMGIDSDIPADADGQGGGAMDVQVKMTQLASAGTVKTPSQPFDLATQMAQALSAGLDFQGSFAFQTAQASFDFAGKDETGQDQTGKGSVTTGAADAAMQLSDQGMTYKGTTADVAVQMTTSTLPFPISYAADRSSFDMLIPVVKGDAAQPFRLASTLEGLTFSDGIWNLFDPNSQLPRDPASLTIDLGGDVVMTTDLFDPALAQPPAGTAPEQPFVPQRLMVNKVALDAVGATADITGELDFGVNPNQPVGTLNGSFEGVNGLLDKLVAMGLVPEDQVMGMRMMLTMFARPAEDNPDRLTSQIEFREGGSIFANGQQVK